MPSIEHWRATWSALGVPITPEIADGYADLTARYAEPHRRYHTARHLDECFDKLAEIRALAPHPAEVELALWFHDAIYDTRSADNEAKSAALADSTARAAGVPGDCAQRITALIMATKHAATPHDTDAKVLVDVDLAILAATTGRFDEYERQVREEYSWVPEVLYRTERKKILSDFLARPAIFSTRVFRERYERQARENLEQSIVRLSG